MQPESEPGEKDVCRGRDQLRGKGGAGPRGYFR